MTDHYRAAWNELTAPGAPFAITDIVVRGVSLKAFAGGPADLRVIWEGAVAAHADKPYLVYEDEHYTYAEIGASVRSLAGYLRDTYGVGAGDRVALAMRNYPEWVIGYWATISLGAAVVGMNAWWTSGEMEYALQDSQPSVLIADDERVATVLPILEGLRAAKPLHLISVRSAHELPADSVRWHDVVDPANAPAQLPSATIDPDDDACIFYTSGTTGFPKGAQLTHRGSVANILNIVFMLMATAASEARAVAAGDRPAGSKAQLAPPTQSISMVTTPLFHVTANNCGLQPSTLGGGCVVLLRRWDAGRALELIEREGVTGMQGVPTMARELLLHPDWATRDTSTLRGMSGGGAPVPPDLVGKIDKALPQGAPTTGYGLTETTGIVTANSAYNYLIRPSSCGPLVPTLEGKLVDPDGQDLPVDPDITGELWVRGSNVIKGYLNKPEATAAAIRDGWFATGDIARIDDDGFVYIVDRAKDMVLRGGENVFCSEVEAVIYQHEAIAEAAVFGIPDERLGEEVATAIVLRPGQTLTLEDLQGFLNGRIAKHKIPSRAMFLDQPLPRNASGKFLKKDLRAQLLAS